MITNPPVLFFKDQAHWQAWLAKNHGDPAGVFIKFAKKASGVESVNYDQALDVALCYGWIDGQKKALDADYYLQKFTPRRAKSIWSKRNVAKINELTLAGRMQPSGLAEVEAAKKDGRWEQAYDGPSLMQMPDDFKAELDKHPKAKAFYATLNKTNTYAVLWRIQTAKKPETRQARMQKIIAMLNEGETFH